MHKDDPLAVAIRAADPTDNLSVVLYNKTWTNPRVFRLDAWVLKGDSFDTRWSDVGCELVELVDRIVRPRLDRTAGHVRVAEACTATRPRDWLQRLRELTYGRHTPLMSAARCRTEVPTGWPVLLSPRWVGCAPTTRRAVRGESMDVVAHLPTSPDAL